MTYTLPTWTEAPSLPPKSGILLASGDTRLVANTKCWPAQREAELRVCRAFESLGFSLRRGSPEMASDSEPHGFIHSQAHGREVFESVPKSAPLVMVEAVWQYSSHVLGGLIRHEGPILIIANWSGTWPGLVGALNLRGSLTKAGVRASLLWSESFDDDFFLSGLRQWCEKGIVEHDTSHVRDLDPSRLGVQERELGEALASHLKHRPAILGVFDEGCMGMFNAIVPDHLLHPLGMLKERLSQATLYARMHKVSDSEASEILAWIRSRGMKFDIGDLDDQLTESQLLEQCRMYVAAIRMADQYGCDAIGIQYQLGLTELCVASDLVEGLLNATDRPPVRAIEGPRMGKVLYPDKPLPHFNEVDECAGIDGLITDRIWTAMGMLSDNTLHDLRWADFDQGGSTKEYVWVLEISGAVPPSHFQNGYEDAKGYRQPSMYFAAGGSGIRGVSKPGSVVWSRIYVEDDQLHMDLGLLDSVSLDETEMQRRWNLTTSQWPIMNAVFRGITRDQMMAKHQSNHIQVVYADNEETALLGLSAKAAMANALGIRVHLCGVEL